MGVISQQGSQGGGQTYEEVLAESRRNTAEQIQLEEERKRLETELRSAPLNDMEQEERKRKLKELKKKMEETEQKGSQLNQRLASGDYTGEPQQ